MKDTTRRVLHVAGAAAILVGPLALALPAQATSPTPPTPADVYIPPAQKKLDPQDIVVLKGDKPGQAKLETRDGGPLALLAVTTYADGRVKVVSPGTDFTLPSTWRELGFGDICWRAPLTDVESYVLPASTLPFVGPPGDWQYSNVIVWSERGPQVFNKPAAGEYVTANGAPMDYVISCVSAGTKDRAFRADPEPLPIATAEPLPIATAEPLPIATAEPLPIASPTPTASQAVTTTSADNDKKVTICHRTNSTSNPYVLETVSVNAVDNSGHLQHTGPIYPQVDADGNWGDVIPPYEGNSSGVNWPAGSGLLDNGCQVVSPPEKPIIPVEPPELPIKPEPPIIEIKPPVLPELPIATLPASPSATASIPIATLPASPSATASIPIATLPASPSATASIPIATLPASPSATASIPIATLPASPSATASIPIATLPASPSATASIPIATIEATPTASATPSPSGTPTSSSTPGPSSTPEASTQSPVATPDVTGGSNPEPTPAATRESGTTIDALNRFCETKDEADLPTALQQARTVLILTNGVSTLEYARPLPKLYCAAQALPGTVETDADLADTGMDLRTTGAASLLLIGLGLLLVPATIGRRRTGRS